MNEVFIGGEFFLPVLDNIQIWPESLLSHDLGREREVEVKPPRGLNAADASNQRAYGGREGGLSSKESTATTAAGRRHRPALPGDYERLMAANPEGEPERLSAPPAPPSLSAAQMAFFGESSPASWTMLMKGLRVKVSDYLTTGANQLSNTSCTVCSSDPESDMILTPPRPASTLAQHPPLLSRSLVGCITGARS